jgi:ribosome biogenesis protein SSF1/2
VVFKILEYALARDVAAALKRPRRPPAASLHPPLVVLQGFGGAQHMKLAAVMFQNMFPAINVSKAKLADCQVRAPASLRIGCCVLVTLRNLPA